MIYLRNLLLLTVSLSGLTFASFTFAQSDADQEEVVVTGSRIERPEISSRIHRAFVGICVLRIDRSLDLFRGLLCVHRPPHSRRARRRKRHKPRP